MTAQILSQVPEGTISKETGRSLFSFIANSLVEAEKVNKEMSEELNKFPGELFHNDLGESNG